MKVKNKAIGGVTMTQNLTYTRCGDYLIPDIQLSHTSDKLLGKRKSWKIHQYAKSHCILVNKRVKWKWKHEIGKPAVCKKLLFNSYHMHTYATTLNKKPLTLHCAIAYCII